MLKRKLLMTILPVLSGAVIVGTGFSAWHFDTSSLTDEATANVILTPATQDTTKITFDTEELTLVLDQGGEGNTKNAEGIYFASATSTNPSEPAQLSNVGVTLSNKYDTYTRLEFTLKINDAYASYLQISSDVITTCTSVVGGLTTTVNRVSGTTLTLSVEIGGNTSFTLGLGSNKNNPFISYVDKPATYEKYETLKTNLETAAETSATALTITATVK